jgi:hypothetical protein
MLKSCCLFLSSVFPTLSARQKSSSRGCRKRDTGRFGHGKGQLEKLAINVDLGPGSERGSVYVVRGSIFTPTSKRFAFGSTISKIHPLRDTIFKLIATPNLEYEELTKKVAQTAIFVSPLIK